MTSATHDEVLCFTREELVIISELLASQRAELLIEIRHTDSRAFRDELRHRLTVVESLLERCAEHDLV
jgi:hypothetical protein